MEIGKDLLELLACPACGGQAKVELRPDGKGVECVACHRVYPVGEDGILSMLIESASQPAHA
jgi:uncharacterized protein YbaR (Trm112 family)